ncbi:hypothetical protein ACTJIL_01050 [Luteimonas sp. 22616]|uniref:hypothetical protein n=1 Tax=Luteimonas sp. 22616 TaxID=3453951 RepID=UPI003F85AA96
MNTLAASPDAQARNRLARAPWVAIAGIGGALLDLWVAAAYWSQFQVEAIRIPQGIAAWIVGRDAFDGGAATALLGTLLYCGLVWAVCALYRVAARHYAVLLRRPVLCGALYGMLAYGVVFWIIAPLLAGDGGSTKPEWLGLCVATYIVAIGIPAALAARATLAGSRD